MVWAAFDRGVRGDRGVRAAGRSVAAGRRCATSVREEILARGYDPERNTFVQHYGSTAVDASLLQLSQIGFVEADDPRMLGTVAAIEEDLMQDGLLLRYRPRRASTGCRAPSIRSSPARSGSWSSTPHPASSPRRAR